MGNKLKVTVTIEEAIVREIDRASKEHGESRSRVIERAIQQWKERQLEKQLIEGYLAMAKEDAQTAEANLAAGVEVLT
ncbi:MAG: ribbon-helix-helix protein, CopG family [Desulfobacterales bacterium]|jgi:metal-responsive CopG/Arc/MetJ family transcriptional regulator|nr:ribbon-helix-helix protein, CopG family [Desulfobacterales bacterium]